MDTNEISRIERATTANRYELFRFGTALLFIIGIMLYLELQPPVEGSKIMLVVAAMIGGYMALNIGANDVANNVGPAVGSQAISLVGAIAIAAIFEAGGALIAGHAVGLYPDLAQIARACAGATSEVEPQPEIHEAYQPYVDAYIAAFDQLRPTFDTLAGLRA